MFVSYINTYCNLSPSPKNWRIIDMKALFLPFQLNPPNQQNLKTEPKSQETQNKINIQYGNKETKSTRPRKGTRKKSEKRQKLYLDPKENKKQKKISSWTRLIYLTNLHFHKIQATSSKSFKFSLSKDTINYSFSSELIKQAPEIEESKLHYLGAKGERSFEGKLPGRSWRSRKRRVKERGVGAI